MPVPNGGNDRSVDSEPRNANHDHDGKDAQPILLVRPRFMAVLFLGSPLVAVFAAARDIDRFLVSLKLAVLRQCET